MTQKKRNGNDYVVEKNKNLISLYLFKKCPIVVAVAAKLITL
jgi:hypothetical protein